MLKIVIPSFNRHKTIKTTIYLDKAGFKNYFVLLHNEDQKKLYLSEGRINPENIIVTNQPPGISNQRRWIVNEFINKNEWFITMDDNIETFTALPSHEYVKSSLNVLSDPNLRNLFNREINANDLIKLCEADIEHCEKHKIFYGGFAVVDNYYFRAKKYRYVGYVISKAAIIKNVGLEYDPMIEAMDDYGFTAENLLSFGKVLINNYIFPVAGHYEKGGIGTYEQRLTRKINDCEYLMNKYPGLFRYKVKKGCHPKAELQVRFTNTNQVIKWRNLRFSTG